MVFLHTKSAKKEVYATHDAKNPVSELNQMARKSIFLRTMRNIKLSFNFMSIIVHIILDNIPGNRINRIIILCCTTVEFNFIFHSAIIIL